MSSFRIRPRFQQEVAQSPAEVTARIRQYQDTTATPCHAVIIPDFIVLKIPAEDQHFWSPQLSLSLEEHEGGTLIRGLYGPKPTVWALFFYGYAALGILALFVALIGTSQLSLGHEAPLLWLLPIFAGLAVGLYIMAQTGQKLGAEQTFRLHHFYEEALNTRTHIQ